MYTAWRVGGELVSGTWLYFCQVTGTLRYVGHSQQTGYTHPLLDQCWASVVDSCLMGYY